MSATGRASRRGQLTLDDFRGGAAGSIDDRRREPRIPCARHISILPVESGPRGWTSATVGLFDCSARGLGLIAPWPMDVDARFFAKLNVGGVALLLYVLRHCRPLADNPGHYKIGAELTGFVGSPRTHDADTILAAIDAAAAVAPDGNELT
jgi:hypothetical protein